MTTLTELRQLQANPPDPQRTAATVLNWPETEAAGLTGLCTAIANNPQATPYYAQFILSELEKHLLTK